MARLIPQETLDDILNKIDIVEVISGYIPLKRVGRNFKAHCPFHQEKTPSFMVSPDRQIYHCFGCNSGGNAFNFIMKYERLEFPEAVEIMAKKSGVRLAEEKQDYQATSINQQIYKVMDSAASFYQGVLSFPSAAAARDYLAKRGIKEDTLRLFRLGFAADKWDYLISHLRNKGFNLSLLEKAGLVITKQGGGYYDRFRSRIVFPILDMKSRVIGLGGRILAGSAEGASDGLAKYINSPETPIYTKGRNLYGLNHAIAAIKEADSVVIVEGYLDCIMPFQEGVRNIVASLGTALTYEQVRLLKRYTHNAVMIYDADSAGEMATLRSLDIFVEEGVTVKVAALPSGFDPDLFVRKNGIAAFKKLIHSSKNLFDYKLGILKSHYNPKQIEAKAAIAQEMLVTIKKFNNAILRSNYIKRLSEELEIKEDALLSELSKIKDYRPATYDYQKVEARAININPTEKLLIKLMLEESDLLNRLKESLEPADFQDERCVKIVSIMFDLIAQGKEINSRSLVNYFTPYQELSGVISEVTLLPETSEENKEKIVEDCVRRLKCQRIKTRREHIHREMKHAQNLQDDELLRRLMHEFYQLTKSSKAYATPKR